MYFDGNDSVNSTSSRSRNGTRISTDSAIDILSPTSRRSSGSHRRVSTNIIWLSEPGPGFLIDRLPPEGQKIEHAFREALKAKTGSDVPAGGHQLAAGGLWLLKLALDAA